jgi:hypothetical protein
MRDLKGAALLTAAVTLLAGAAQAQSCAGYSSMATSRMNVGANAWFPDGATRFGAHLNMKNGANRFLGFSLGATSHDAIGPGGSSETSTNFGAMAGIELKATAVTGLEWCPMANVSYQMGPGDDVNFLNVGGGVGLSKSMGSASGFEMVPFGKVGFLWSRSSVTIGSTTTSSSDTALDFGVGLGFRLSSGIQLSPQVRKTTFTGSEAEFGLTLSIPIGG